MLFPEDTDTAFDVLRDRLSAFRAHAHDPMLNRYVRICPYALVILCVWVCVLAVRCAHVAIRANSAHTKCCSVCHCICFCMRW